MKEIKEAVQESIDTDSIVHVTIISENIYNAMEGVDYDDAIQENDGSYDVWGDEWRLNVTIVKFGEHIVEFDGKKYNQEQLREMAIAQAADDSLRRAAEKKYGGWISNETWEMMKKNGEV